MKDEMDYDGLPKLENLEEAFAEPIAPEDVYRCAEQFDGWVDELTDKFLDGMPSHTAADSYHIENLMHSHRQIAQMMHDAVKGGEPDGQ